MWTREPLTGMCLVSSASWCRRDKAEADSVLLVQPRTRTLPPRHRPTPTRHAAGPRQKQVRRPLWHRSARPQIFGDPVEAIDWLTSSHILCKAVILAQGIA